MAKAYILYNPLSGDGKIRSDLSVFEVVLDEELVFTDITEAGIRMQSLSCYRISDETADCHMEGKVPAFSERNRICSGSSGEPKACPSVQC